MSSTRSTARFGRGHKIMALVPLAVLSVAWTASIATTGAGTALADAQHRPEAPRRHQPPDRGHRGPGQRLRRRRRRARHHRRRPAGRRHRLDLRHPGRRARGLPARRDRHQLRRPRLPPRPGSWSRRSAGSSPTTAAPTATPSTPRASPGPASSACRSTAPTAPAGSPTPTPASTTPTARWDRAVGPMQFIPSTWSVVGVDADGDGQRNPQDVDDAALATAVYLCSGDDDLGTTAGQRAAVYRYNHSESYVDLVLSIMDAYLDGEFTSVPNGVTSAGYVVPQPTRRPAATSRTTATRTTTRATSPRATTTTRDAGADEPTSKPTQQPTQQPSSDPTKRPDRRPEAAAADPDAAAAAVDLDHPGRPAAHPGPGPRAVPARRLHRQHPQGRRPVRPVRVRLHPLIAAVGRGTPRPVVEVEARSAVPRPPQRRQEADRGLRVRSARSPTGLATPGTAVRVDAASRPSGRHRGG